MSSVTAQLQLLQQLEGQLLKLRKEKGFIDPAVRDVRKQFRASADSIMLKNYRAALVSKVYLEFVILPHCGRRPVCVPYTHLQIELQV